MDDQHRYRTLLELPEYTAQFDAIVAKYSLDVVGPVLTGLLWGIAKAPKEFAATAWNIRMAKSSFLGLTVPRFSILFQIENEGQEDERVLLCWIEEISTMDEITGYVI